jgi:hypothetical protein
MIGFNEMLIKSSHLSLPKLIVQDASNGRTRTR